MTDQPVGGLIKRTVDIDSAIGKSSFQLPVFVAISAEGGEAQVVKTFATAREVFDHVFSILLDRMRQRLAVEAVAGLVPQSPLLTTSADTEYVLLVRGKAIFWFSGAAAKRSAGRRLLLEHARDLAEAEQAPFYVLNTRAKKIRAAIVATGLLSLIPAGVLLQPFAADWSWRPMRRPTESTPHPGASIDAASQEQVPYFGADIGAGSERLDPSVERSAAGRTASRHLPPPSVSGPVRVEPENREMILQYEATLARFARAWPDRFEGGLWLGSPHAKAGNTLSSAVGDQPVIAKRPRSTAIAKARANVPDPGVADRAPAPVPSTP